MREKIEKICINKSYTIKESIRAIDRGAIGIALVVGKTGKLLGLVTDGDIRRAVLKNIDLDLPVSEIMITHPIVVPDGASKPQLLDIMHLNNVRHIPIVNRKKELLDLALYTELTETKEIPIKAVIMAGGLGSRLRPLTFDVPKPLLKISEKSIMELMIGQLREAGIKQIIITTWYKSEAIKDQLKDGSQLGVEITYVKERKKLGTAGALTLAKKYLPEAFLVVNGDILTKLNFEHLLSFHQDSEAELTVAIRQYDFEVPFGVVDINHDRVTKIEEKPLVKLLINAGMYLVNKSVIDIIPHDTAYDMPDLIQRLLDEKKKVCVFPIQEYWMDVGRVGDLEKAIAEAEIWREPETTKEKGK